MRFSSQLLQSCKSLLDLLEARVTRFSIFSKSAKLFDDLRLDFFGAHTSFFTSMVTVLCWPGVVVITFIACPGCFFTLVFKKLLFETPSTMSMAILELSVRFEKKSLSQIIKQRLFVGLGESIMTSEGDGVKNAELYTGGNKYLLYPKAA